MSNISLIKVRNDDYGLRLDTWFKKYFPNIQFNHLQKLLRTGQIRVNGSRVKCNAHIEAGQTIRIPPLTNKELMPKKKKNYIQFSKKNIQRIKDSVIHCDDNFLVINKPNGLPVQG